MYKSTVELLVVCEKMKYTANDHSVHIAAGCMIRFHIEILRQLLSRQPYALHRVLNL